MLHYGAFQMQVTNTVRLVEQTALLSVQTLLGCCPRVWWFENRDRIIERVGVLRAPSLIGFMIDQTDLIPSLRLRPYRGTSYFSRQA